MANYYCDLLDDKGRIRAREFWSAASDREAMDKAEECLAEHPFASAVEVGVEELRVGFFQRT